MMFLCYIYIYNPGYMIKIAAMPIYGKNPSKFSGTAKLISSKLGMNRDHGMTLTSLRAKSTWVASAFIRRGKILKCLLKEKPCRKMADGQDIDFSVEKNGRRASSTSIIEAIFKNIQHVYWYIQQISGERLQDHWSSALNYIVLQFSFILDGPQWVETIYYVAYYKTGCSS